MSLHHLKDLEHMLAENIESCRHLMNACSIFPSTEYVCKERCIPVTLVLR